MATSLYKKVGIASLIMMASVFFSRLIGLFREMAIAYVGGTSGEVDAYQVAFILPEILNHILASGFLSVTFIPIFSRYLAEDRESEGWHVFSLIMTGFGSILLGLIVLAHCLTPQLIHLLAPGLKDPNLQNLAIRMTRIILPAQFFFFSGGLLMAVQFAKERFTIPALAPLIYNLGIIAGGFFLGPWIGMEGFAWGVLAGAFVGNFALQIRGARGTGMTYRFFFDFSHPDLLRYVLLTLPLMLGLTMSFSTEVFLKFFGSFMPRGGIATLNYGLRVMLILVGFFGQAVGVGAFPFMARLAAEGKLQEMNDLLNRTLRYLSLVIPVSVLFMVLRREIIRILFQRGRFDAAATEVTAGALVYLLVGAAAFAAQTVVVRGYYATQNTLFPAIFSTLAVAASIPLYVVGMRLMGIEGIALAISLSALLQSGLLYGMWNRSSGNRGSGQVLGVYARVIAMSIPIGFFMEWICGRLRTVVPTETMMGSLVVSLLAGGLFLVLTVTIGHLLGIREFREVLSRLGDQFRHRIRHR